MSIFDEMYSSPFGNIGGQVSFPSQLPLEADSPFGTESQFNVAIDLPIEDSTEDNVYTYKFFFVKSGTEVFELYGNTNIQPKDKQILIFYELESDSTNNLFGTACRVKMGNARANLMKSLSQRKRLISIDGNGSETRNLEDWAKEIAKNKRSVDAKVLANAVLLELMGKGDIENFLKHLLNLNNIFADLITLGVEEMESWKFTEENYEYGIKGYKPLLPVPNYQGDGNFTTNGKQQLQQLSRSLDKIILQTAKVGTRKMALPVGGFLEYVAEEWYLKNLPDSIKSIIKKARTLLRDTERFIDDIEKNLTQGMALANAFLCGLINGLISLVQSIFAILAFAIDKYQLAELENLGKEKLAANQQNLEFLEDVIDIIIENAEKLFKGVLAIIVTLPGELLQLAKALGQEIKGFSKYFWAFFIGGVLFEVLLDILLAYLTGGVSAYTKAAEKISRVTQRLTRKGIKLARDTAQQAAKTTAELLRFLRKELEELVDAVKSGKFIEYIRKKIFALLGKSNKVNALTFDDLLDIAIKANINKFYSNNEFKDIIRKALILNVDIQDFIGFIKVGNIKSIKAKDLVKQIDNYINIVLKRGYPFGFNNLREFKNFGTELKVLLKRINLDSLDIRIQGSALRVKEVSKIEDFDIAIFLKRNKLEEFINLTEEARNLKSIRSGNPKFLKNFEKRLSKGKISSFDFPDINENTFDYAKNQINSNKKIQISIIIEGSEFDIHPYLKF